MAGVITYGADAAMLEAYADTIDLQLRLFRNDRTPTKGDAVGDYDEAAGGGYAPLPLNAGGWSFDAGPPAAIAYPAQTFVFTGVVGNVYGYFLTDTGGDLAGAERFADGPYDVRRNGDRVIVTPTIAAAAF